MRFIKNLFLAAVLPLLFVSCGDDVVNNYYGGGEASLDVTVSECDYETITAHKSYFDPDYVSTGYYDSDFIYGIKLVVKLNDPSKRGSVNRLVASSGNYGYDFNKQELEEAYVDSVGGYVFDFLTNLGSNNSSLVLDIKLYDASNNSSKPYPLIQKYSYLYYLSAVNDWASKEDLEISLQTNYNLPAPGAKAEVHYLNSKYEEIGICKSDVVNNKWKAAGVPSEAVYFYFVLTDKYSDVSRKFISGKFTIKDRLPDNVEFISAVESPAKIEYLKNLNKVLTLSTSGNELALLNYEDNSLIWKKQLKAAPATFAYSAERNAIYLAYTSGAVDSINPADGTGKQLFTCSSSYGISYILPTSNNIIVFTNSSSYYYRYNFATKQVSSSNNGSSLSSARSAVYVPRTKMAYVIDDNYFVAFYVGTDGTLTHCAGDYISNSSLAFRCLNLGPDSSRLYTGEGYVYNTPTYQNTFLTQTGSISRFTDMTVISSFSFATVSPELASGSSITPAAVSVYNSSAVLQGKLTGIAGTPKKVFYKDNALKIYSVQGSGRLIAQKYTVQEIINSASGKMNRNRKIYAMKKL
ncbi:MAG TPA: hypothetical protein VHP30_11625 [Ignavibacteriales bacterium]|nr:hypothetical protein [Ignavibacteriales bacterium]